MGKLTRSKARVKKYGEVFTPDWMVKKMCDLLDEESTDAFTVLTRTFLEPACGTGNFLVEILRRKLAVCETALDGLAALGTIYGIDILGDNVEESRRRMYALYTGQFGESVAAAEILRRNIVRADALKLMRLLDGDATWDEALDAYHREEEARRDANKAGH